MSLCSEEVKGEDGVWVPEQEPAGSKYSAQRGGLAVGLGAPSMPLRPRT